MNAGGVASLSTRLEWAHLAARRTARSAPTLAQLAQRAASVWGERTAFVDAGAQYTFAQVFDRAQRLASALRARGLLPGDVISFQLPNWVEAAVINLAACLGGWICNPIVPIYRDAELVGMLGDCRSRVLFVPGLWRGTDYLAMACRVAATLPALAHVFSVRAEADAARYESLLEIAPAPLSTWPASVSDAIKLVMYTSGTTGAAKGVLHSHATLPLAVERAFRVWNVSAGDRVLMPSPVTHATGYCVGLELPFSAGTTTVLMERWDAADAARLIRTHGIKATVGATPFLQELIEHADADHPLPLRVFACGGAAVPADLVRRASARLDGFACRVYGATEAPLVTCGGTAPDDADVASTTDGRLNGYEVRIVDLQDRDVAATNEGEILVRGDGLFLGYTQAAATHDAFTADGWFRTGDLGVLGAGNTLTLTGRKKDLIIRGGENISAKEIEDVLHTHPAILEAAVVAAPHTRMGETVAAVLRLRGNEAPSVDDLAVFVREAGLARQKCPELIRVIADFPRTASGKVRKDELRRMLAEAAAS